MKTFRIEEKFTGYAEVTIEAETEEEAMSLYNRGHYKDSELLEDFEDLFEVYDIIGEIKNEYEKKLEIAQAKQPKAEW